MAEYIEREAAILVVKGQSSLTMTRSGLIDSISKLPAADVAPVRHGRWIASHDEFCTCSICKYPVYVGWNQTNYCSNCGAKMDGGDSDEAD